MIEEIDLTKLLSEDIFTKTNSLIQESVNLPLTVLTFEVEGDNPDHIHSEVSLVISCLESKLEGKFVLFTDTVNGLKTSNGFTFTKKKPDPERYTRYHFKDVYLLRALYVVFDSPEDYLDYLEKRGRIVIGGVR